MQKFIIIAIDGPAASGKSTLAKDLADKLGYLYVDTGAMYRAITFYALEHKIVEDNDELIKILQNLKLELEYENKLTRVFINNEEVTAKIRTPEVNSKVSDISKIKEVRTEMVKLQREMANNKNLVVEGRDTTTVVFPNADLKIFLTADVKERARRRYLEYKEKGEDVTLEDVEASINNRDHIDSSRDVSPLKKADDAIEVDTTNLTIEEEINGIVARVNSIEK
ncbi:MAG: (d)CMP kinase [Ignavibacteriae bacterium]|nr:(d)CMP kinase [Ignavibacteriota bacterium]